MRILGLVQNLTKEALGGTGVAPGGEREVDRLPMFVHSTVKVFVFTFNPDVCLIYSIALCGRLEMTAATLL